MERMIRLQEVVDACQGILKCTPDVSLKAIGMAVRPEGQGWVLKLDDGQEIFIEKFRFGC